MRLLLALLLLSCGCAGAEILSVEVPDPSQPLLLVRCRVSGALTSQQRRLRVVADWGGYRAEGGVPLASQEEDQEVTVALDRWTPSPRSLPANRMEVRFKLRREVLDHRVMAPLWPSLEVVMQSGWGRPEDSADGDRVPPGWGEALLGSSLATQRHEPHSLPTLPEEMIYRLDGSLGARFLRIEEAPLGSVDVEIDVVSLGQAGTGELTAWRATLLDAGGSEEAGFVVLGGRERRRARWTFDGGPATLLLYSESDSGDLLRLRFERRQE